MADERCTSLYGVPTMFIAELDHPDFESYDLTSLRTGIMAGSPCPVEVMKRVIKDMHMDEVTICYGMTETSPVSTQTAFDDPLEKRVGTVGRVHPHLEIRVTEDGELCTKGYSVMLGYWDDPERTAEAVVDGWMHTGDLATIDDEGYINIVGRIKDMIIRGGENVYPRELEEFLYTHPDVADVQVIGVPDERYGEELMAWVIPRAGRRDRPGGPAVLVPRADRPLQDPALRQGRRGVPDDRHRQGPEVQAARAGDRRARPRRGRRHQDGLAVAAPPRLVVLRGELRPRPPGASRRCAATGRRA